MSREEDSVLDGTFDGEDDDFGDFGEEFSGGDDDELSRYESSLQYEDDELDADSFGSSSAANFGLDTNEESESPGGFGFSASFVVPSDAHPDAVPVSDDEDEELGELPPEVDELEGMDGISDLCAKYTNDDSSPKRKRSSSRYSSSPVASVIAQLAEENERQGDDLDSYDQDPEDDDDEEEDALSRYLATAPKHDLMDPEDGPHFDEDTAPQRQSTSPPGELISSVSLLKNRRRNRRRRQRRRQRRQMGLAPHPDDLDTLSSTDDQANDEDHEDIDDAVSTTSTAEIAESALFASGTSLERIWIREHSDPVDVERVENEFDLELEQNSQERNQRRRARRRRRKKKRQRDDSDSSYGDGGAMTSTMILFRGLNQPLPGRKMSRSLRMMEEGGGDNLDDDNDDPFADNSGSGSSSGSGRGGGKKKVSISMERIKALSSPKVAIHHAPSSANAPLDDISSRTTAAHWKRNLQRRRKAYFDRLKSPVNIEKHSRSRRQRIKKRQRRMDRQRPSKVRVPRIPKPKINYDPSSLHKLPQRFIEAPNRRVEIQKKLKAVSRLRLENRNGGGNGNGDGFDMGGGGGTSKKVEVENPFPNVRSRVSELLRPDSDFYKPSPVSRRNIINARIEAQHSKRLRAQSAQSPSSVSFEKFAERRSEELKKKVGSRVFDSTPRTTPTKVIRPRYERNLEARVAAMTDFARKERTQRVISRSRRRARARTASKLCPEARGFVTPKATRRRRSNVVASRQRQRRHSIAITRSRPVLQEEESGDSTKGRRRRNKKKKRLSSTMTAIELSQARQEEAVVEEEEEEEDPETTNTRRKKRRRRRRKRRNKRRPTTASASPSSHQGLVRSDSTHDVSTLSSTASSRHLAMRQSLDEWVKEALKKNPTPKRRRTSLSKRYETIEPRLLDWTHAHQAQNTDVHPRTGKASRRRLVEEKQNQRQSLDMKYRDESRERDGGDEDRGSFVGDGQYSTQDDISDLDALSDEDRYDYWH